MDAVEVTAGDLRDELAKLPDTARILLEEPDGRQYAPYRAMAIGTATDDPGLILKILRTR